MPNYRRAHEGNTYFFTVVMCQRRPILCFKQSRSLPVEHGLVEAPKDWEYSAFHRYVREGLYGSAWEAGRDITFDAEVGNE